MVGQKENMSVAWENQSKRTKKYANYILLRNPGAILFKEIVLILKKNIQGEKFSIKHNMAVLKPDKKSGEDYSSFAGIVNRECERFKLKELTPDMFKCLIFVQGLTAPEDGEIRTRILSKLEQNPKISLQMVAEECERLENLRHDTARIE